MQETLSAFVYAIRYEAPDVVTVDLRPASPDVRFPPPEAGAHIDLHLPNGLIRSYSLCEIGSGIERYVIGVLNDRASRGGSRYVHEVLRVGTPLQISLPRNHFKLLEDSPEIVLIAGGIGITPILAMLQRLYQLGRAPHVVYCARTQSEAAFIEDVKSLTTEDHLTWHFDDEAGGPPDLEAMLAGFDPGTHFYCCGPTPMLSAYENACSRLGFDNVHLERFSAPVRESAIEEDGAFEVELRASGRTLLVPADKTILQVLLDAGIDADYSCEEGVCGSCETRIIEGDVDHRDCLLSEAERRANKTMMICVSRCRGSRLVLEK